MRGTNINTSKAAKKVAFSVFSVLLLGTALLVPSQVAVAQASIDDTSNQVRKIDDYTPEQTNDGRPAKGFDLTGTWTITITPDDGTPPFIGYYSFSSDGNASFSSAGPPIPGLGNPGYGVWKKVSANKFAATIRMISYSQTFQFDGTLKISAKIRMTSHDRFVTQDSVIVYDVDGNEIVTLGGGAEGKRMVVQD